MRPADEPLVRCGMTVSTRLMERDIRRITGERAWQLLRRLMRSEWERLHPGMEAPVPRADRTE